MSACELLAEQVMVSCRAEAASWSNVQCPSRLRLLVRRFEHLAVHGFVAGRQSRYDGGVELSALAPA